MLKVNTDSMDIEESLVSVAGPGVGDDYVSAGVYLSSFTVDVQRQTMYWVDTGSRIRSWELSDVNSSLVSYWPTCFARLSRS